MGQRLVGHWWGPVRQWAQTPAPLLCRAGVLFGLLAALLLPVLGVRRGAGEIVAAAAAELLPQPIAIWPFLTVLLFFGLAYSLVRQTPTWHEIGGLLAGLFVLTTWLVGPAPEAGPHVWQATAMAIFIMGCANSAYIGTVGRSQARWRLLLAGGMTVTGLVLTTLRQPYPLLLALLLYADAAAIAAGWRWDKQDLRALLVVFTGVAAALAGAAALLGILLRP